MMILTEANSHLVYQSALAATKYCPVVLSAEISGSPQYWLVSCQQTSLAANEFSSAVLPSDISLERVGEWAKLMRI
jgi:hypothetical protein